MINANVLKGFGLFAGVADSDLLRIAEICKERPLKEGERIFVEGTRAIGVHLCRSGKVDLAIWVREPWNKSVTVHQAVQGELFGWSALVAPYTYTASAECVEAGQEIYLKGSELLDIFDSNPNIGYAVLRNLTAEISTRLAQTRQRLSTEWLSSGNQSSTDSNRWGEPNRR